MPINNIIKIKRGDQSDWSSNPVLSLGEPGYDTTNNILKVGDGTSTWSSLSPVNLDQHLSVNAASSSDNDGNTFVQDLLLDSYGHVTGITVATASEGGTGGISNVVEDTTPQLGGNLDLLQKNITGVGNIDINGNITANSGAFSSIDLTPVAIESAPPHLEGRLFYDSTNHTLSLYNDESDVTLQLGQEEFIRVRNNTDGTITNGSLVYITGSHANAAPAIDLAIASNNAQSAVAGFATHDIETGTFGYVTSFGLVRDVATSGITAGSEIYLSTTSGAFTATSPVIPNYSSPVGYVIREHATNGTVLAFLGKHKLGGGDLKSEATANLSGVPFVTTVADNNGGGLTTSTDFVYDSGNQNLYVGGSEVLVDGDNISQLVNDAGYLTDIVNDTTPQLGGNLDAQSNQITAVSKLEITNTSTDDSLLITTTEDSSTAAPVLTFKRNSSTPDNGDYLGQLKFKGENDADQEVVYAKVTAKISDVTDTTEDGLFEFALRKAGSNNIGMRLTSTSLNLLNGTEMDMGSQQIHSVLDPTSAQDAATKNYVDNNHITVSAASSSDNSGRTYIQDVLLDSNGHVTGLATATETVVDTDTTYTAGTGLLLDGTEFNVSGIETSLLQGTISNNQLTNSSLTITAGTGLANGGSVSLGSSVTIDIDETVIQSGDNVSFLNNDAGYLTSHPTISAASSSDNSGRTYIQDITLDSNGHVIGLATATETVTDTDTTYSAGSGLSLDGTTFNSLTATTTTSGITTLTNTINTDEDKALTPKAVNDAGYLTSHPTISAASSSDNSGRTYIQDITLDSNGHVIGLATATETVTDTDTTYSAGSGLSLDGTTFNALTATTTTSGITTLSNTINSDQDKALTPKAVNDAGYLTAHPTISAASSVDNSNGNVIQDITLDSNGHVTVLGSVDLDSRYYTETEIDAFNYVDGGGTANYVAKWSDTDTLTSGIIYDDGTDVGIGTASPGYKLDVNGTFSANSINVNDAFTFPTADGSADQYLKTDGNGNVTWSTIAGGGGGISNVVEDTTPQLGGTLDLNGNNIEGYAFETTPTGTIIGASGWVYQSGQQVLSNGSFGTHIGDAQFTQNILRAQTTDATVTNLEIGTQSGILLASNRTYNFTVNVVGRRTNGQDNAGYKLEGLLFNDGYGTEILGNPIKTTYYESDTTWDVTVAVTGAGAGGTDYLLVRCQGAASKDINWVAHVDMLEVGGNITNYTEANILGVNSKIVP